MSRCLELARKGMGNVAPNPMVGCVIVYKDRIIGEGYHAANGEAHAEVNAIRDACSGVLNHHLTGAVIYTNFEPCPMCLAAIYWSDIRTFYFSAGRSDAEHAGFMDKHLYREVSLPPESREIKSTRIELDEMTGLLDEWDRMEGKILY